jgi:hypothetical protein
MIKNTTLELLDTSEVILPHESARFLPYLLQYAFPFDATHSEAVTPLAMEMDWQLQY